MPGFLGFESFLVGLEEFFGKGRDDHHLFAERRRRKTSEQQKK
jgi:hypothetical protein